jgi:hypothetical protein
MKKSLFTIGMTLTIIVTIGSCGQKTITEENITPTTLMNFDKTGYTFGTIVQSKTEGDCEWTIKLENGKHLDPKSLEEDFMKNGMSVWIKYTPQRRMQRCENAMPVGITEIKMNK